MNKHIFAFLNGVGLVIFTFFAWLQREDDNPDVYANPNTLDVWMWVVFYGLIAGLFGLALAKRFPWPLYALSAAFCLFQWVTTGPGLVANLVSGDFTMGKSGMNPDHAEVELSREFFGAVIAFVALTFLWLQRRKVSRT